MGANLQQTGINNFKIICTQAATLPQALVPLFAAAGLHYPQVIMKLVNN
jgi:hypothetical protein